MVMVRFGGEWCTEHLPARPGICHEHKYNWDEFHNEELKKIYGIDAIFYCPVFGCDEFEVVWQRRPWVDNELSLKDVTDSKRAEEFLANRVFKTDIRLKIIFHKLALREGDGK